MIYTHILLQRLCSNFNISTTIIVQFWPGQIEFLFFMNILSFFFYPDLCELCFSLLTRLRFLKDRNIHQCISHRALEIFLQNEEKEKCVSEWACVCVQGEGAHTWTNSWRLPISPRILWVWHHTRQNQSLLWLFSPVCGPFWE